MANTDKRIDELSNLSSLTGDELVLLQNPTTLEYGKTTLANVSAKSPVTSVAGKTGAVSLTKDDVGLSNVENTADANKPISSATQAALNAKEGTINPGNTGQYFRGDKTWQTLDKSAVGLGNADNTSDLSKPISTATQSALDTKATTTALDAHANSTSNPHNVTKAQVGLGNAENTSDADKPVSTAQQTALDGKANFPSTDSHVPVRDGSGAQSSLRYTSGTTGYTIGFRTADGQIGVGAPTDNTHATNKGYVDTALNAKANASDTVNLTGNQTIAGVKTYSSSPVVPTATTTTQAVNKSQMDTADALKVNKAGDTMTGDLTTPNVVLSDDGSISVPGTLKSVFLKNGTGNILRALNYNAGWADAYQPNSFFQFGLPSAFFTGVNGTVLSRFGIASQGTTFSNTGYLGLPAPTALVHVEPKTTTVPALAINTPASYAANMVDVRSNGSSVFKINSSGTTNINGVDYVTGTGFPEGVVTAPVGSIYIDKAITNGIAIWYKKTGTASTGWIPLSLSSTPPATATSTGISGQTAYDSNYYYICVATNTWKRTPLSSW